MEPEKNTQTPTKSARPRPRRISTSRILVFLLLGAAALMVFNVLLGDFRRKQNALAQARVHAQTYTKRAGDSGVLPLNLEPDNLVIESAKMFRMEWLSFNDARLLRNSPQSVIIAQTAALPFFLYSDARAVIIYNNGQYNVQWMTLLAFDQRYSQQQEELKRITAAQHEHRNQP